MLDKIQDFYTKHKMYVNIAIGVIIVWGLYKALKK